MSRQRIFIWEIVAVLILFTTSAFPAETCFNTAKSLNVDAQTIRLKALDMGWRVGKAASLAAASLVKGKRDIYPVDNVEVCLREEEGRLQVRVQSKSRDASQARWRNMTAKNSSQTKNDVK